MTLIKTALKTADFKRIVIELHPEHQVLFGYDEPAQEAPGEKPDYDLGLMLDRKRERLDLQEVRVP